MKGDQGRGLKGSISLQGRPDAEPRAGPGSRTGRDVWRRPHCGVPDHPSAAELRRGRRRKRFSVFGGRWEKTQLTYK